MRRQRNASQLIVLCLVLGLHVAVFALFIFSSKVRQTIPNARPIELIYLPSFDSVKPPTPTVTQHDKKIIRSEGFSKSRAVPKNVAGASIPGGVEVTPRIDWEKEARLVSNKNVDVGSAQAAIGPAPQSPFAQLPRHRAGEEFVTVTGERAVFINNYCYQVAKTFVDRPTAISNGMGAQTYCIRKSNKPRGDLFDRLPAYKTLHPDP
jgi:hypothetical protein